MDDFVRLIDRVTFNEKEKIRIEEAGIEFSVLYSATSSYLLTMFGNMAKSSERLCSFGNQWGNRLQVLHKIFPNAKFVQFFGNGYSELSKLYTENYKNLTAFEAIFQQWNETFLDTHESCENLTSKYCMKLLNSDLTEDFSGTVTKIVEFLNLSKSEETENLSKRLEKNLKRHMANVKNNPVQLPFSYDQKIQKTLNKIF